MQIAEPRSCTGYRTSFATLAQLVHEIKLIGGEDIDTFCVYVTYNIRGSACSMEKASSAIGGNVGIAKHKDRACIACTETGALPYAYGSLPDSCWGGLISAALNFETHATIDPRANVSNERPCLSCKGFDTRHAV